MWAETEQCEETLAHHIGELAWCIYKPRNAKDGQQPPEARGMAWNKTLTALQKDTVMLDLPFSRLGDSTFLFLAIQFVDTSLSQPWEVRVVVTLSQRCHS